jgi:hypothetical protein
MIGCTYQPKIYLDGRPILNDISYSYNDVSGISTKSVLMKRNKAYEGNESYIAVEYYSPIYVHEFDYDKIHDIIYNLSVNNTKYYAMTGKGFKYNLYQVMRVLNHKRKSLLKMNKLVYNGHLSFKEFAFNLPHERGDEVNCYFEFRDKDNNILFKTLEINYKIK